MKLRTFWNLSGGSSSVTFELIAPEEHEGPVGCGIGTRSETESSHRCVHDLDVGGRSRSRSSHLGRSEGPWVRGAAHCTLVGCPIVRAPDSGIPRSLYLLLSRPPL